MIRDLAIMFAGLLAGLAIPVVVRRLARYQQARKVRGAESDYWTPSAADDGPFTVTVDRTRATVDTLLFEWPADYWRLECRQCDAQWEVPNGQPVGGCRECSSLEWVAAPMIKPPPIPPGWQDTTQ